MKCPDCHQDMEKVDNAKMSKKSELKERVMRLLIEITDDTFTWDYKIGLSEQKGTKTLTEESFLAFAQILSTCHRAMDSNAKERLSELTSEVGARAYMQDHPEDAQIFLNKLNTPDNDNQSSEPMP